VLGLDSSRNMLWFLDLDANSGSISLRGQQTLKSTIIDLAAMQPPTSAPGRIAMLSEDGMRSASRLERGPIV